MDIKELLRGVVKEMVEARIRETDITDGSRVSFGSEEHIADLEMRIADLERWRDRQRRGSEARANYARLIGALRRELRSAKRITEPHTADHVEDELSEDDKPKAKLKTKKCVSCDKPYKADKDDDLGLCEPCGDAPAPSARMSEADKSKKVVHWEHTRGTGSACGKSGAKTAAKADVTCLKCKKSVSKEKMNEAVDMEDPEYASIESFVQYLLDEDRTEYTHEELAALNFRTRMPINAIRKELESYGLKLAHRAVEKQVRGFTSNSHDRWFGKGSMPTHGGAGIDPKTGRATTGRGDI